MPKFAKFDPTATSPQVVAAWYDTDTIPYPSLPPESESIPSDFIEVTEDIWALHLTDIRQDHWTVVNGVVTHTTT